MAQSEQGYAILRFIKKHLPSIRNSDASYVDECDPALKDLEIEIEPLCFDDDDNSRDDGEVSSEPLTFSRMSDLLKEKEPWATPNEIMDMPSLRDVRSGNCWAARFLGMMLLDYLELNRDDDVPGILQDLGKDSFNFPHRYVARFERRYPCWRVDTWIDSPKSPEPHLSCFVSEESDLKEQQLSMSVLQICLAFTHYRLRQEKFKECQSAPIITIISASGLRVRIHRASFKLLEGRKGRVSVKKSPIIDLTDVEGPLSDDIVHILRWMLGSAT
ncbi:hypothetical protein F5B19DRAFT_409538 [Rostrohypoxylon terebratum]|nr:hypothetical protein F5B19DRAFT_409538 [Rostrohypoxylon terebratum]